jgi:hypothetical protein
VQDIDAEADILSGDDHISTISDDHISTVTDNTSEAIEVASDGEGDKLEKELGTTHMHASFYSLLVTLFLSCS